MVEILIQCSLRFLLCHVVHKGMHMILVQVFESFVFRLVLLLFTCTVWCLLLSSFCVFVSLLALLF